MSAELGWSDGRFVEVEEDLSDVRLAGWFDVRQIKLADGQRADVNVQMLLSSLWAGYMYAEETTQK